MRIITISREFGSGGRELGKRLDWNIKDMAPAVAELANRWFGRT